MLDVKDIRENPKTYKTNFKRRKDLEILKKLDDLVEKDKLLRKLKVELDGLRSQRNKLSQDINKLRKEGKKIDPVLKKVKSLPKKLKTKQEEYDKTKTIVDEYLHTLPNFLHEKVPYGKSDKDNVEIKTWGRKRKFSFPVKNHVELLEALDAVDFEASGKSSGNGFYYLKGDFALLNQALIRFVLDYMQAKDYTYIEPPLMLRSEILFAAVDKESFEQSVYSIENEDLAMIGTSEYSLLAMHKNQILDNLPRKYFSYSMCFRKEIGAHGINQKGLWRTHQFNKVEQFVFCTPEQSWKMYDELMKNSQEIFKALKLPFRVLEICTGDLPRWKARSADIEVWRPTINDYGEVTSLTNCTDYHARNLNVRYKGEKGREVCHTLNNTAMATSRVLVAIAENHQQRDGSIKIPEVLWPYMHGKTEIKKKS